MPVLHSQSSWILWAQQNHTFRWIKMVLTLLVVNKSSRMLTRLNKITDACLSLQRTVLIFVYEKNWSIHLFPALSGNQTPSQQEDNSPQEERRPKLLLLLVLKNKATLLGERRSQVIAPKAHLHPKCLCTEGHRVRGVKRAGTRALSTSQGKHSSLLPYASLVAVKVAAPEHRYQPNGVI